MFDFRDEHSYDGGMTDPQVHAPASRPASGSRGSASAKITARQLQVLDFIAQQITDRGYPPSVREIGEAIGLTSPSTVHSHLNTLQRLGYLRRDPTKPRAIEVRWDPNTGAVMERRPVRHVPLVGDVAAGTDVLAQENVEELFPLPIDFVGDGDLFMLRVRGESMIEAGILDGDFVVVRTQSSADEGEIVVAGIPGEEATVKTYRAKGSKVTLVPANESFAPMVFDASEVTVFGKVVTVLRRL
jgi:repressor LexA